MFKVYKSDILDVKCTSCFIFIWTTGRDSEKTGRLGTQRYQQNSDGVKHEAFVGRLRNMYAVVMGKTEWKRKHARLRYNPWMTTEFIFTKYVVRL